MAADAKTATAPAAPAAPAPQAVPPLDPRLSDAARRLGLFYATLVKRRPNARGLDLLPGERRGGTCIAQIGLGIGFARSLDYVGALVVAYGPGVVGERDLAGARKKVQGWVDEYVEARDWDPLAGKETAKLHDVDTAAFRADFDLVVTAADVAGPRAVSDHLERLGAVLREKRLDITPQWCATISGKLAKHRAQLLEQRPSAKHMREDTYDDVYVVRGATGREKFAPVVAGIKDPLLSSLFANSEGLEVLRSLARSPDAGGAAARALIGSCERDLDQFVKVIGGDVHWRYPEFIPAVVYRLGLGTSPGLSEYLIAIADSRVIRTTAERVVEIGGLALMALALMFSGGAAGVAVAAAGVGISGLGLGVAYVDDRNHAFAAGAYSLELGDRRIVASRFPLGTALALVATVLSAIGFYFAVSGLGRAVPNPPLRPGAPRPPGSAPGLSSGPPPKPSPTSPGARAIDPPSRLIDPVAPPSGSRPPNEAPRPYASVPPAAPRPVNPPSVPPRKPPVASPSTPPPPGAPRPARRPPGAPRDGSEEAQGGRPSQQDRNAQRVRPDERGVWPDAEQIDREAVRDLERRLRPVAREYARAIRRIRTVIGELEGVPANAEIVRQLRIAARALEDPAGYGRLVVELRREVDAIRNAGTSPAAWEIERGLITPELRGAARLVGLTEETVDQFQLINRSMGAQEFFDNVVIDPRGMVDLAFAKDVHGALTHALQDWIITNALTREGAGTAAGLRVLLGTAEAPSGWIDTFATEPRFRVSIGARAWAEIWDSEGAGSQLGVTGMHSPEFLSGVLREEFPGIVAPRASQ